MASSNTRHASNAQTANTSNADEIAATSFAQLYKEIMVRERGVQEPEAESIIKLAVDRILLRISDSPVALNGYKEDVMKYLGQLAECLKKLNEVQKTLLIGQLRQQREEYVRNHAIPSGTITNPHQIPENAGDNLSSTGDSNPLPNLVPDLSSIPRFTFELAKSAGASEEHSTTHLEAYIRNKYRTDNVQTVERPIWTSHPHLAATPRTVAGSAQTPQPPLAATPSTAQETSQLEMSGLQRNLRGVNMREQSLVGSHQTPQPLLATTLRRSGRIPQSDMASSSMSVPESSQTPQPYLATPTPAATSSQVPRQSRAGFRRPPPAVASSITQTQRQTTSRKALAASPEEQSFQAEVDRLVNLPENNTARIRKILEMPVIRSIEARNAADMLSRIDQIGSTPSNLVSALMYRRGQERKGDTACKKCLSKRAKPLYDKCVILPQVAGSTLMACANDWWSNQAVKCSLHKDSKTGNGNGDGGEGNGGGDEDKGKKSKEEASTEEQPKHAEESKTATAESRDDTEDDEPNDEWESVADDSEDDEDAVEHMDVDGLVEKDDEQEMDRGDGDKGKAM